MKYDPTPFRDAALDWMARGMAVIPLMGTEGKSPAGVVAKFNRWTRPPGRDVVNRWIQQHPSANVGIVTSPSKLTVVDVDGDETLMAEVTSIFGEARVMVRTPKGFHLYYRSGGEGCSDLRGQGMSVDIKGIGGLVVAPPSHNFLTGGTYEFARGSLHELSSLSAMRAYDFAPLVSAEVMAPGRRNNGIFRLGLQLASRASSLEDLSQHLQLVNAASEAPLPTAEVAKTAASAWRYHNEGRNFHGKRGAAMIPGWLQEALASIRGGVDALWLYCYLLRMHAGRGPAATFAIAPKAFVFNPLVPFGEHRIRHAIKILVHLGALKRIKPGGRGVYDPAMYALGTACHENPSEPYVASNQAAHGVTE